MLAKIKLLKFLFFTVVFFYGEIHVKAQDIIIKNDKTEIKAKVIELTEGLIKYKKSGKLDGPLYSINKDEVFMIVYKDGTIEYIEVKKVVVEPAATAQTFVSPIISKAERLTSDSSNVQNKQQPNESDDKGYMIFSTNDGFTSLGLQYAMPLKGHLYLGLDYIQGITGEPSVSSYGAFLGYKYPITQNFSVWSNAEYLYTTVESFKVEGVKIPASSAGGFTWAVGSSFVWDGGWGVTSYTYEGQGFMFGIVYSR